MTITLGSTAYQVQRIAIMDPDRGAAARALPKSTKSTTSTSWAPCRVADMPGGRGLLIVFNEVGEMIPDPLAFLTDAYEFLKEADSETAQPPESELKLVEFDVDGIRDRRPHCRGRRKRSERAHARAQFVNTPNGWLMSLSAENEAELSPDNSLARQRDDRRQKAEEEYAERWRHAGRATSSTRAQHLWGYHPDSYDSLTTGGSQHRTIGDGQIAKVYVRFWVGDQYFLPDLPESFVAEHFEKHVPSESSTPLPPRVVVYSNHQGTSFNFVDGHLRYVEFANDYETQFSAAADGQAVTMPFTAAKGEAVFGTVLHAGEGNRFEERVHSGRQRSSPVASAIGSAPAATHSGNTIGPCSWTTPTSG